MLNSVKFLSILFFLMNIGSLLCLRASQKQSNCKVMGFNYSCNKCNDGYAPVRIKTVLNVKNICKPCAEAFPNKNCQCRDGRVTCYS